MKPFTKASHIKAVTQFKTRGLKSGYVIYLHILLYKEHLDFGSDGPEVRFRRQATPPEGNLGKRPASNDGMAVDLPGELIID